jgi:hypothetical protein
MVLGYHKGDMKSVPRESEVLDALRPFNIAPGPYAFPKPSSMKEMGSPAFLEKVKKGPVMHMTVLPNAAYSMNKNLIQWFLFSIVISLFAAYVAGRALGAGAPFGEVLRYAGTVAFASYGLGQVTDSIWWSRPWSTTWKNLFDGLVYAVVTGATFGWLWPR